MPNKKVYSRNEMIAISNSIEDFYDYMDQINEKFKDSEEEYFSSASEFTIVDPEEEPDFFLNHTAVTKSEIDSATDPRSEYSTDAGASYHPWNTGLIYGLDDNESVTIRHYCDDGIEANWSVQHSSENDYCEYDETSSYCLPSHLCMVAFVAFVASMASLVLSLVGR